MGASARFCRFLSQTTTDSITRQPFVPALANACFYATGFLPLAYIILFCRILKYNLVLRGVPKTLRFVLLCHGFLCGAT